jgi:hypothetical protein
LVLTQELKNFTGEFTYNIKKFGKSFVSALKDSVEELFNFSKESASYNTKKN